MRARVESIEIAGDTARMNLVSSGDRPIDERLLAYFERSDLFGPAQVVERRNEAEASSSTCRSRTPLLLRDRGQRRSLTRTMKAGQISLAIGLLATFVAIIIGVIYGATSGYLGGRVDLIMMRVVDILYSLPFIFFVIMLVVFFGRNFVLMFLAVGAVEWLDMARIVRGQTLSIKRQEFARRRKRSASKPRASSAGMSSRTRSGRSSSMTLLVPKVILLESFLSFLGLGVQEPNTSLGVLIAEGAKSIQDSTWMLVYPALTLVAILFCLNFIGDGLRDALDPKDR